MNSYGPLAGCYDNLTTDVDYKQWAAYIQKMFHQAKLPGKTILDLACGTGSLTFALAELGYEMIAVDSSADMLSQASKKAENASTKPLFLNQPMEKLDLFGTIDGCVCCLDSINYVTSSQKLQQAFRRVHLFLNPKGKFLFDIKAPQALFVQDDAFSIDETEDIYCVWRSESSQRTMLTQHFITLFQRRGDHWVREDEVHTQKIYQPQMIQVLLENAGFSNVQLFGNLSFQAPTQEDDRYFFLAEKA